MATTTNKAVDTKQYEKLVQELSKQLKKSKTAYTPNVSPTTSDLQAQIKLLSAQKTLGQAENEALKRDIYGSQEEGENLTKLAEPREGLLKRTLNALGTPLYAIVGATEAALGKGTKPGLENIAANIKERGTFGDLFRSYDVNKWAALPLGLAMDIALDPVNWLTAGTAATVPKLAAGLRGAGVEGLQAAAKASVLQKGSTLANRIPFLSKTFVPSATRGNIAKKASEAEEVFRKAVGKPSVIEEVAATSAKPRLGDKLAQYAKDKKIPGYETFEKYFRYSPGDRFREMVKTSEKEAGEVLRGERGTIDEALSLLEQQAPDGFTGQLMNATRAREQSFWKENAMNVAANPPAKGTLARETSVGVQDQFSKATKEFDDFESTLAEQLRQNIDDTGVKWYDDLRRKANSTPFAKKLLDTYEKLLFTFKLTKVPLNPTAYTNAIIGNHVMAGMMGLNVTDANYLKSIRQAWRMLNNKTIDKDFAFALTANPKLEEFVTKYEKVAKELGLNRDIFDRAVLGSSLEDFGRQASELSRKTFDKAQFGKNTAPDQETLSFLQRFSNFFSPQNFRRMDMPQEDTSILHEIFYGPAGEMMERWRNQPEGVRKKIADLAAAASENYQNVDYTFKIGNLLHLVTNGVTEGELRRISRFVKIDPTDVEKVGDLYKFSPLKAAEVSNEAFMNYAAMPAAVRVLRSMPILGSPFVSFTYGMLGKAGKTLVQNPSLFNKVTFTKDEISRTSPQTPLEKSALEGPYYNYLNTYERVKMPFFQSFPTYLNISSWLPYLGLNMFQPSERKYTTDTGAIVGGVFDKLPFLKTPEGQVLFDYFVQPFILNETQPTGLFGQPLYRQSDTALKKGLRAGESLLQGYVPTWVPPGYRFKQLSNALQGKTPQGVDSAKSGYELTTKAGLSTLGFPLSDINLTQQASQVKKQVEPKEKKK